MDGEILYRLGTDINSSATFENGDLILATGKDNLVQAVLNRLNTDLDELDTFYESDYGSVITGFLGWKATEDTLNYIQIELDNVLLQEPRILSHESTISYTGDGKINIDLTMTVTNGDVVETNLVLGDDGIIENETDETEEDDEEE